MTGPVTGADRPGRMRRGAARFAVLLVVCLGAGLGLAGPAAAHNVLIASDPADGAVLQQSPTVISLTFDQPVQDFQPVVTVLGADGQRYESGTPSVDSTVVTQSVTTLTAPGPYSIAYRVVSADGHPVQGEVRFELAAAGRRARPRPAQLRRLLRFRVPRHRAQPRRRRRRWRRVRQGPPRPLRLRHRRPPPPQRR